MNTTITISCEVVAADGDHDAEEEHLYTFYALVPRPTRGRRRSRRTGRDLVYLGDVLGTEDLTIDCTLPAGQIKLMVKVRAG